MKSEIFYGWLGRFVRSFIAILFAGAVAQYGNSELYLVIAPAIMAASKFLRDKYGIDIKIV